MCLLISAILGILYSVYLITYFSGAVSGSEGAAALGAGIAVTLVMPHIAATVLATVFTTLGVGCKQPRSGTYRSYPILRCSRSVPSIRHVCSGSDHPCFCGIYKAENLANAVNLFSSSSNGGHLPEALWSSPGVRSVKNHHRSNEPCMLCDIQGSLCFVVPAWVPENHP